MSETGFFKHKYLIDLVVTHADRIVNVARELFNVLHKKKSGTGNQTMQALQDLSRLFLKRAEGSDSKHREEDDAIKPKVEPLHPRITQVKPTYKLIVECSI